MKPYPAYKDSGIEWIGEIPEGWGVRRLKYCDLIIMGQSPSSEDYNIDSTGLPFLQGNADFTGLYPEPRVWCDTANKIAKVDDILLSVRAPIGAINLANQEYGIGRGLCAIRPVNTNQKYLYYLTLSLHEELNSIGTGSTYTAISVDDIRNTIIPQPLPSDQLSITSFLDHKTSQIDSLIEKKQKLIELLKEQRIAIINQAVTKGLDPDVKMKDSGIEWIGEIPEGWGVIRVKHLGRNDNEIVQTGPFGVQLHASDYVDEGIPLILIKNVKNLIINDIDIPKVSIEKAKQLSKYRLRVGDIVFSRVGSIGRIALVTEREEGWLISGQTLRIRINNPILQNTYSKYIFSSNIVSQFVEFESVGTTRESLNTDILRNIPIILPSLPEQQSIVNFLDQKTNDIDSLIEKQESSISLLQEFRSTLISNAVTGKIDVRAEVIS